jgi:hypothetical protein
MNPSWVLVAIGLLTCVLNLVVTLTTSTWVLARGRGKLVEEIMGKVAAGRQEVDAHIETSSHDIGEALAAMRRKVEDTDRAMTQIELWTRDNLVSKTTFNSVIARMEESWRRFEDRFDGRLTAISDKLDAAKSRIDKQEGAGG